MSGVVDGPVHLGPESEVGRRSLARSGRGRGNRLTIGERKTKGRDAGEWRPAEGVGESCWSGA